MSNSYSVILMVIKGSPFHLPGADFNRAHPPKPHLRQPEREKLLQGSVQVARLLCREKLLE